MIMVISPNKRYKEQLARAKAIKPEPQLEPEPEPQLGPEALPATDPQQEPEPAPQPKPEPVASAKAAETDEG